MNAIENNQFNIIYENLDRYIGEVNNQKKEGEGVYYFHNQDRYEGAFQEDQMHGYGKFYFHSGCYYEGDFYEGLRQGMGILTFEDECYEGEFFKDEFDGKGVLKSKEGTVRMLLVWGEF